MKLIGFWLLVLLAVLVPATASIATSMICPTVSVAKAHARGQYVQAESGVKHAAASGSHARVALPKAKSSKAADTADQQGGHCCDATPCSQCAGCGTCASLVAADFGAQVPPLAIAPLLESRGPRAEFLLSGQERPPRSS
ncbi:hypothetical protein [Roseateles sp.]|uniref:hypothetical protein n=1 Tax=Roseateles sp. TaxID=1971397 RepID=UPI0039EB5235